MSTGGRVDVVTDHLTQGERPWHVVDERDHVDAEGRLHRRVLEELVQDDLGYRVALELDHDPHPVTIGFVTQVAISGIFFSITRSRIFRIRPPSPPLRTW